MHTQPTFTFHRCRAASPAGEYFTMNECSVSEVMNIQSAEAGYSVSYNPSADECSGNDCTRPIQQPITLCNGSRSCRFPQSVLLYPQGDVPALCPLQRDANFIRIKFTCVTGMILTFVMLHYINSV